MIRATGIAAGVLLVTSFWSSTAEAAESRRRADLEAAASADRLKLSMVVAAVEVPEASAAARIVRTNLKAAPHRRAVPGTASGGSSVAYAVSREVRLGLGYDFLTSEDLDFEVAETGSLDDDYASHRVMVRAHLKF